MRVKYVRKNANGVELNDRSLSLHNYTYDRFGDVYHKNYGDNNRWLQIGDEANVYALTIRDDLEAYYILDAKTNSMVSFPAICFEILDDRISKYWRIERQIISARGGLMPHEPYEVTYFAFKEWIQEPYFLDYVAEDKERECSIMNKMIILMDEEFQE